MDRADFLDNPAPGGLVLNPAPLAAPPISEAPLDPEPLEMMMDELEETFGPDDVPIKPPPGTKRRTNVARSKVISD